MSKVLPIPDVHLKYWIFDEATKLIENDDYEKVVIMGDLVDDWNQEKNIELYRKTFNRIYEFLKRYPETFYCIGNHDISYLYNENETGFSSYARDVVVDGINNIFSLLPVDNSAFIHKIDGVIFSHSGLTEKFVKRCFGSGPKLEIDDLIDRINRLPKNDIWREDSVIWARPQYGSMRMYPMDLMQIVGHTPVKAPLIENGGKLLTVDTFSTYPDGNPIGNGTFVWVDSVTDEWGVINDRLG